MNEEIILGMAKPYIKDNSITFSEFDSIYNMLSIKEQYKVLEILLKNGICLADGDDTLDVEEDDNFTILYDDGLFSDARTNYKNDNEILEINNVKQSNNILCHLIQEGHRQATQDLCVKNKRLVDKYAFWYEKKYGKRVDFFDLEQAGFIGLIKAAQKFDFSRGTEFSTYAVFWIKQSISREIMDTGNVIRIPVHMMERIVKVVKLDNKCIYEEIPLEQRLSIIANHLQISEDDVKVCMILKNNYLSYISLNTPIGEGEETELGEMIPEEGMHSTEDIVIGNALKEKLNEVLKMLNDREQAVLRLRFGLDDDHSRTLEEIGQIYNLTRERIRQIEEKALRKLRKPSKASMIKSFLYEE